GNRVPSPAIRCGVRHHGTGCPLEPSDQPVAANHQWRPLHDGYGAQHSYLVIAMFNKILVVCVGNICRSPTAERLLKNYQPNLIVESAGLGALVGKGADERATNVAQEHNLSLDGHVARQVSGRMCRDYDLILAME